MEIKKKLEEVINTYSSPSREGLDQYCSPRDLKKDVIDLMLETIDYITDNDLISTLQDLEQQLLSIKKESDE